VSDTLSGVAVINVQPETALSSEAVLKLPRSAKQGKNRQESAVYNGIIKSNFESILNAVLCQPRDFKTVAHPVKAATGGQNSVVDDLFLIYHCAPPIVYPLAFISLWFGNR
jgi:hypothetical protein